MKRSVILGALLLAAGAPMLAADLPITRFTVVAKVISHEHYPASPLFVYDFISAPYGGRSSVVAEIVFPRSLAGREVALPFEWHPGQEGTLLAKPGTVFRWESHFNLQALHHATASLRRAALPFPQRGIIAFNSDGSIGELYPGRANSRARVD